MERKRTYVKKARAEREAATRQRIVEATVGLHLDVGPAATRLSEVARRAGVQRVTVYNHFPDEASLLSACSAHWRALHPAPDTAPWREIANPALRARTALRELYAWYRETAPMTANVLRDAQTMPALYGVLQPGLLRYLETVAHVLASGFDARRGSRQRVARSALAAVDFAFWRALEPLGDSAAAELGAGLVELAAAQ